MGRVRALQEGDIPQVIDLHRRVLLPGAPATDGDVYRAYFKEMFLDPPWVLDQPSLVYRSEEHSLNSSHTVISYAVFCLKKKKNNNTRNSKTAYIETVSQKRHSPTMKHSTHSVSY